MSYHPRRKKLQSILESGLWNKSWVLDSRPLCTVRPDGVSLSLLPALISKSDSGQDSSSPSTTPHTRGFSSSSSSSCAAPLSHAQAKPQGPPTLALAQPPPPRVPPTSSHAPHLGPPYPLPTPDVLVQSITAVPPPSLLHPALHPPPMLQSTPALIKVRNKKPAAVVFFCFFFLLNI